MPDDIRTAEDHVQMTGAAAGPAQWKLSAKLEPFDSFWQAPKDVEKGYKSFYQYYRHNYLPRWLEQTGEHIDAA